MNDPAAGWEFWVDRGGTFTDVIALTPDGRLATAKLLSENPSRYADAAVEGISRLLGASPGSGNAVESVKIGTTVATNALLERQGSPVVFVTTEGFGDALRIGTQQRPDIFALDIRLPEMLYARVVEAKERVAANGEIVAPLDEPALEAALETARRAGFESAAIAFMHAYRFPEHELRAEEIARRVGFREVSVSHRVSRLIKLVDRGHTTVADAYLTPVLRRYVDGLDARLARDFGAPDLMFMQSHGGLVDAGGFRGCNSILSGPAGGVVGMAATAAAAGFDSVIGFDMGGTSTDVSVHAGEFERAEGAMIGGVRVVAPMMRINTVAAGGGSILKYEGGRPQVGPESAGAYPGPACYRNGGPLTLTDANVFLGRIQPDFFPEVFGESGDEPIDSDAVAEAFVGLGREIGAAEGRAIDSAELAAGYLRIAVDHMAAAIAQLSAERGHDVASFALSCFGGAGGQHACQVADELGVDRVLIDPLAGVLSAYGIGVADLRSIRSEAVERRLDDATAAAMTERAVELERELAAELGHGPAGRSATGFEHRAYLRVAGTDAPVPVPFSPGDEAAALAMRFDQAYRRRFGFGAGDDTPVVESLQVEVIAAMRPPDRPRLAPDGGRARPVAERRVWFAGGWRNTPVYRRQSLGSQAVIEGPAIIAEENATTVVEEDWRAQTNDHGVLILSRRYPRPGRESIGVQRDPVMLEVFNNQFMHVAEQMGVILEQTAHSVNIKERLDYSCALFDSEGGLIANAPHVPVHLGSMGETVRAVLESARDPRPGDSYMLNAPYSGGTHLPDITVVTPVFEPGRDQPSFVVASRAHHADIGGITPGSMPAKSRRIDEEGVVFACTELVRAGRLLEPEIRALLRAGPYPARNPDQNVADLKAQLAANARGADEVLRLIGRFGSDVVHAYMQHVQDNAEECVRRALESLSEGARTVELDGGERINVAVRIDRARSSAEIDFTGTSGMSSGNFNAPPAIARAVVLYVFRTLIVEDIPLNAGCLKPLEVTLPPESLLDPRPPAAVVAGNVETSQCIADALLGALGVAAASQGTMNNFTFGDSEHQYYETLCGGCGAGNGFDGASAVHSHMTNSRLTDAEVLERRFPVRVRRFEVRRGSGGEGRWHGGDGVVREIEFLKPLQGSILSNRRRTVPFGIAGGGNGLPGRNVIVRASGAVETVGAAEEMAFGAGDRFVIETPGGGGYGEA